MASSKNLTEQKVKVDGKSYVDDMYEEDVRKILEQSFKNLSNKLEFEDVKEILEEAQSIVREIIVIISPIHDISQKIVNWSTEKFIQMLRLLSQKAGELENIDILNVTDWVVEYKGIFIRLGLDVSLADDCIDPLVSTYVKRMLHTPRKLFLNILEEDRVNAQPQNYEEGLFRLLEDHIQNINVSNSVDIMFRISLETYQVMVYFQETQKKRLEEEEEIGVEPLCAMINNNMRCYDFGLKLSNSILESLRRNNVEQVNFEDACKGFLDVANVAVHNVVNLIFEDPLVNDLLVKLYQKECRKGKVRVSEELVAIFYQYFTRLKLYIQEIYFGRIVEACLEKTVIVYVDNLLTQSKYIKETTIELMKVDEEVMMGFFVKHMSFFEVQKRVCVLGNLREFVSANNVESFISSYKKILEHQPNCPPQVVEKLIGLLKGISPNVANEVIQECNYIYQDSLIQGRPSEIGFVFSKIKCLTMPQSQGTIVPENKHPIQGLSHIYKLMFDKVHK